MQQYILTLFMTTTAKALDFPIANMPLHSLYSGSSAFSQEADELTVSSIYDFPEEFKKLVSISPLQTKMLDYQPIQAKVT